MSLFTLLRIQQNKQLILNCKSNLKYFLIPQIQYNQLSTSGYINTIKDVTKLWRQKFEDENIPEPIESIEHIIAHIIGTSRIMELDTLQDKQLTQHQLNELNVLCECRLARMPVQYIIGEWDFRDITLKLVPPIFIPRPETEILIDIVLKRVNKLNLDICDIMEVGCGSGAISLALLHACKKIRVVSIDTNIHACELTLDNAENLNLLDRLTVINATLKEDGSIKVSSSNENFERKFHLIVSNPPYVPTEQIYKLMPEIKLYEDLTAIDGGSDGLKVIKPLLNYAGNALRPEGRLFIEIDSTHSKYIQFYISKHENLKLKYEHTYKDFCNEDRFVEISKLN